MATETIEPERLRFRGAEPHDRGDVVVYWMHTAHRAHHNEALEYAVQRANDVDLPVAVVACLPSADADRLARHLRFELEGLLDARSRLERRSIAFTLFAADPDDVLAALDHRLRLLVTDRAHLPRSRDWCDRVEGATTAPIVEVETNVVVPTDTAGTGLFSSARSIRPRIHEHLDRFVVERRTTAAQVSSFVDGSPTVDLDRTASDLVAVDLGDGSSDAIDAAIEWLRLDVGDRSAGGWSGGNRQGMQRLRRFCDGILPDYRTSRQAYDIEESSSRLSPYLRYGQLSPVEVARLAQGADAPADDRDAFIEEVVVRRELAVNHALHEPEFGRFGCLPDWARHSLRDHEDDERDHVYTASELEEGRTHDAVWNAIMGFVRNEGWVHNQLRMYWGKQIVQWTNTPDHAYRTLLDLNNRYFLDGCDPNSYANVAWCFGLHDRGFAGRDVTGKLRPFTRQALRRKGDLDRWLERHGPT